MLEAKNLRLLQDEELYRMFGQIKRELKRRRKKKLGKRPAKLEKIPYGGKVRYWNLYVLLLTGGKYYVGITAQKVQSRYQQHVDGTGFGSKWTKLHKPIGIIEHYPIGRMSESEAVVIETAKTMELIAEHGTMHVRGGALVATRDERIEKIYQRLLKVHQYEVGSA